MRTIIESIHDKKRIRHLVNRGVHPQDMMSGRNSIDLKTAFTELQHKGVGLRPVTVNIKRQVKNMQTLYENPFNSFKCVCITSYPSDLLAKRVAIWLMDRATTLYYQKVNARISTSSPPLWHTVYGGYKDRLRDGDDRPSFLVLANITIESTAYKLETVRDLLEKYRHIPRIVVAAGTDPLTMFRSKLFYPTDAVFYLGGNGKELLSDIDL